LRLITPILTDIDNFFDNDVIIVVIVEKSYQYLSKFT